MKHKNSHLLVGYWSRLRRGRAVPDQADIDPRAIKRMLSHVFILEMADAERPLYRLAGTSVCERFGAELKGTNFLMQWDAESRNALVTALKQARDTRQPVCLSSIGTAPDCGMVEMETVLAPVSAEGSEGPVRFIGMVQVTGDLMHLAGRPITMQRLIGSQLIHEAEPMSTYDAPPMPPPPPQIRPLRSHPRAPYLRLVVSREKPAPFHREMDERMERLKRALDIMTTPSLSLVPSH